jgi:LSD1 subclass zinc finger protein
MDETQLRLDGNAAAGVLREVFVQDLSAARCACAACGTVAPMGSQHLYMYPSSPGAVLRCATCQAVLMVFVHAGGRYRLGLRGLTWLEIRDSVEPAAQA